LRSQERISYNHQFEAPVNVGQGGPQVPGAKAQRKEDVLVSLTCPTCGNQKKFLVKTLQMHVVQLDDSRVEVSEETRPVVLEVLCDECESALKFEEFEDTLRKEVLLTLGAR
jgi:rubredoxin